MVLVNNGDNRVELQWGQFGVVLEPHSYKSGVAFSLARAVSERFPDVEMISEEEIKLSIDEENNSIHIESPVVEVNDPISQPKEPVIKRRNRRKTSEHIEGVNNG